MKALCTHCQVPIPSDGFVYDLNETGILFDLLRTRAPQFLTLVSCLEQRLGRSLFFYPIHPLMDSVSPSVPNASGRIFTRQVPITAQPIQNALQEAGLWPDGLANRLLALSQLLEVPAPDQEVERLCRQLDSGQPLFHLPLEVVTTLDDQGAEIPLELRNPATGRRISGKYCPHCHQPMSDLAGIHHEVVVALAGAERIGKTAVATAAISCLLRPNPTGLKLLLPPDEDPKWSVFQEHCLRPYEQGRAVLKTHTGQSHAFSVTLTLRIPLVQDRHRDVNLTIVDLPGEFFSEVIQDQWFAQYGKLYQNASAIWFPTDLAQLAQLLHPDPGYGYDGKQIAVDVPILRRNLNTLRQRLDTSGQEKPFCIILNKSDMTAQTSGAGHLLYSTEDITPRYLSGSFLLEHSWCQLVANVRRYIQQTNASYLAVLEEAFPLRTFVALSAYGHPVDQHTQQVNVPYNVAAPVIWSLAMLSLLPVVRVNGSGQPEAVRMNRDGQPDPDLCRNLGHPDYDAQGRVRLRLPRPPAQRRGFFARFR